MLTKLKVENFRLLRSVEIDFEPGKPVVLIGPNSSGKTTVLTVLEFLRRAATEGLATASQMIGHLAPVGRFEYTKVTIVNDGPKWGFDGPTFDFDGPDFYMHLTYEICLTPGAHVKSESLLEHSKKSDKLSQRADRNDRSAWIWNHTANRRDAIQNINADSMLFQSIRQGVFYPELSQISDVFSVIRIYGEFLTTPAWGRDPRETAVSPADSAIVLRTPSLSRRGLDLVNALFHIQNEDALAWDELLDAFRAEFPFVVRIEFPPDPSGGRIGLGWRDKRFPGIRMSGYQMSEGMLSFLCLLATIFSAEPTSILGFDEPDLHLHPSAVRRLVHLLEQKSHKTPVIIATHSDRLLDYLSDPAGSIRVCEPTADGVEIKSLDRAALDEWRQNYRVSELRERGHLDSSNENTSRIDS